MCSFVCTIDSELFNCCNAWQCVVSLCLIHTENLRIRGLLKTVIFVNTQFLQETSFFEFKLEEALMVSQYTVVTGAIIRPEFLR